MTWVGQDLTQIKEDDARFWSAEHRVIANGRCAMLPKPLYEALPLVYITSGVACTLTIQGGWALVPAASLFAAAGLVMKWRHDSRAVG
jgi:hypothetical protein